MVHEVFFPGEALLANLAAVRRLARVFPDVVHHVLFAGECLCAEFASDEQNKTFPVDKIFGDNGEQGPTYDKKLSQILFCLIGL